MGDLRQGTKSDLIGCLDVEPTYQPLESTPTVDAKVLDGAVIVHMPRPGGSRTFQEYAQNVFIPYIASQMKTVSRIDVVWSQIPY